MRKLILLAIILNCTNLIYSQVDTKIATFLGCSPFGICKELVKPNYYIPLIKNESQNYVVTQDIDISSSKENVKCLFYFDLQGNFIFMESVSKVSDSFKLPKINIEKQMMTDEGEKIVSSVNRVPSITFQKLWEYLNHSKDIVGAKEINISFVNYIYSCNQKYSKPVFIINVWNTKNPTYIFKKDGFKNYKMRLFINEDLRITGEDSLL